MKLKEIKNNDYLYKILSIKTKVNKKRYEKERYFVISKNNTIFGICRIYEKNKFETWFENQEASTFFYKNFNFKEELKSK
jgi:hypothetical protein